MDPEQFTPQYLASMGDEMLTRMLLAYETTLSVLEEEAGAEELKQQAQTIIERLHAEVKRRGLE